MKSHYTVTITIPTAKIMVVGTGLLVGLAVGALLVAAVAWHVELWVPIVLLPGMLVQHQASQEARTVPEQHPAIAAFDRVPLPVRVALDRMVDRVIAEKRREAA